MTKYIYPHAVRIGIEGAFSCVRTDTIMQSLDEFEMDQTLIDWPYDGING